MECLVERLQELIEELAVAVYHVDQIAHGAHGRARAARGQGEYLEVSYTFEVGPAWRWTFG